MASSKSRRDRLAPSSTAPGWAARWLALLVAVAVPGALVAGPEAGAALAHGETTPLIQTLVDGVSPPIPGVSAETGRGLPNQLTILNRTKTEIQVLGMSGHPFIRIGPGGVFANVTDLAWYRSGNPDSVFVPPAHIRVGGASIWVQVSTEPIWSFFDFRLRPSTVVVPDPQRDGRQPARLDSWSLPLRYGGQSAAVHGHVEFVPIVGEPVPTLSSPAQLAPGLLVARLPARRAGLALSNSGPRPVTVMGTDGEPFARIGPNGVVVNLRSPTYAYNVLVAGDRPTVAANPTAPPLWRRVSDQPFYDWLDPRMYYASGQPAEDVIRADHPKVLMRWSVPVRDGSRTLEVQGTTTWFPLTGGRSNNPKAANPGPIRLGIVGGVVLIVVLLALALRRRQGHAPEPRERAAQQSA